MKNWLLLSVVCILGVFAWDNDFEQTLYKQCPAGTAVSRVVSQYSSTSRDRRFRFDCTPIPGGFHVGCQWQGPENNFFGPLISYCPMGKVMRRVFSTFQNGDRRWYIYCCGSFQRKMINCRSSRPGTGLTFPFIFQRPNSFLFGIIGFYYPRRSDRRFHFGYCEVSPIIIDSDAPQPSAFNATVVRKLLFEPEDIPEPETTPLPEYR